MLEEEVERNGRSSESSFVWSREEPDVVGKILHIDKDVEIPEPGEGRERTISFHDYGVHRKRIFEMGQKPPRRRRGARSL